MVSWQATCEKIVNLFDTNRATVYKKKKGKFNTVDFTFLDATKSNLMSELHRFTKP